LRKHPNWNEEELAIIIDAEEGRTVDEVQVRNHMRRLMNLIFNTDRTRSASEQCSFCDAVEMLCTTYSRTVDDEKVAQMLRNMHDVMCVAGQGQKNHKGSQDAL